MLAYNDQNAYPNSARCMQAVDYGSEDSLKEALSGVEVVISTLSQGGFAFQTPLFEAAKAAGVKLAVPSEFGNHTTDLPEDSVSFCLLRCRHAASRATRRLIMYTLTCSHFTSRSKPRSFSSRSISTMP